MRIFVRFRGGEMVAVVISSSCCGCCPLVEEVSVWESESFDGMLLGDAVDDDVDVAFVSGGATWVDWYRLVFNVHDFEVVGGAKAFAPLLDAAVARTIKSVAVEIFAIVEDCCCNEMNAMS